MKTKVLSVVLLLAACGGTGDRRVAVAPVWSCSPGSVTCDSDARYLDPSGAIVCEWRCAEYYGSVVRLRMTLSPWCTGRSTTVWSDPNCTATVLADVYTCDSSGAPVCLHSEPIATDTGIRCSEQFAPVYCDATASVATVTADVATVCSEFAETGPAECD